jgi:hypothetical protein
MISEIRVINNSFHKVVGYDTNTQEEKTQAISNFKMEIVKRVYNEETDDVEDLILFTSKHSHIKASYEIIELKNFANSREFKKAISRKYSGFNWAGGDNDLEGVKEFINKGKFQTVKGTNVIGINELDGEKYFVNNGICLNKDFVYSDKFLLYKRNTINLKNTFKNEFLSPEDCKSLESKLFDFNIPEISYSLISLASACFLNPILDKNDIKMPTIGILGEPGGGKTDTKDHIFKSIFYDFHDEIAADIKPFGAYKNLSETNIIPFSIEEYKTWTMSKNKQEFVRTIARSSYDKHVTTKGHADQSITRYKINSPLLITGESIFEEKASKERCMILQFAKQFHTQDRYKSFIYLKKNKMLLNKLGNSLLKETLNIDEELLIKNYYLLIDEISKNYKIPDRIINNIAVTTLGYNIIYKIFKENNIKLLSTNTAMKFIINSQLEFNLEGENENKGLIEQTIESFGEMISNSFLPQELNTYFIFENDLVYVSLKNIFPEFTRYLKIYDIKGEFETRKGPFEQLLSKSKYFVTKKRKNSKWYVVLDMNKIKESNLDFDKPEDETQELLQDYDNTNVRQIPEKKEQTLNYGDIFGDIAQNGKFDLNTKNVSEVKGKIFIDNKGLVHIPFTNPKVQSQCVSNMCHNGKKLFEVGDNYKQKAFENRQMKLY